MVDITKVKPVTVEVIRSHYHSTLEPINNVFSYPPFYPWVSWLHASFTPCNNQPYLINILYFASREMVLNMSSTTVDHWFAHGRYDLLTSSGSRWNQQGWFILRFLTGIPTTSVPTPLSADVATYSRQSYWGISYDATERFLLPNTNLFNMQKKWLDNQDKAALNIASHMHVICHISQQVTDPVPLRAISLLTILSELSRNCCYFWVQKRWTKIGLGNSQPSWWWLVWVMKTIYQPS